MTIGFAAPRRTVSIDALGIDGVENLIPPRQARVDALDPDEELDPAESFELPGADLSGEELKVAALPRQADEFVCGGCFLIVHRSRLAAHRDGQPLCRDCG